jgi:hypothetical protein
MEFERPPMDDAPGRFKRLLKEGATLILANWSIWGRYPAKYGGLLCIPPLIVTFSCGKSATATCPGGEWLQELSPRVKIASENCPPLRYQDAGACPFEGCIYRDWTVTKDTGIYADWKTYGENAAQTFHVRTGEKVQALTGVVVIEKPGVMLLKQAHGIGNVTAQQGDLVYVLTSRGEGFAKVMFRSRVFDNVDLNDYEGKVFQTLRSPEQKWWVQIRNNQGRMGWTKEADNFKNKDRFE